MSCPVGAGGGGAVVAEGKGGRAEVEAEDAPGLAACACVGFCAVVVGIGAADAVGSADGSSDNFVVGCEGGVTESAALGGTEGDGCEVSASPPAGFDLFK